MIVSVLIPLALNGAFTYKSMFDLEVGDLVHVPFGSKKYLGLVIEINSKCGSGIILKNIEDKIENFSFSAELIAFISWVANYNLIPIGNVLKMAISPLNFVKSKFEKKYSLLSNNGNLNLTAKQYLIVDYLLINKIANKKEILENAKVGEGILKNLVLNGVLKEENEEKKEIQNIVSFNLNILSKEQEDAFNFMKNLNDFNVFVLDGATGSGKTEVYFHYIADLLKEKEQQILFLLPEIALTSQLVARFEEQFSFKPALWHSDITESSKSDVFKGVFNGNIKVVIGTRSSLFLPFKNLKLIIVDEEHDSSYKQTENSSYNGRDLAVVRAKLNNIPIILGSATPSLETLINIDKGKYKKIELPSRFGEAVLPNIKIVDMKKEKLKKDFYISEQLRIDIQHHLMLNQQVMLFLNRRGYSPVILCGDCGNKFTCSNCSSNLTYHKFQNKLLCHHCNYSCERPRICSVCGSENLIEFGPGVEKIENEILTIFPQAKTIIIASDTVNTNTKLEIAINKILNNEVNIIIGTQLIAKGHHFPNLTLVGILDSDASLFGGDIRAGEKTYQLLTQVSGRAGRESVQGIVYFQSYNPNNLILQSIKNGDKNTLINFEKQNRELGNFPPFGKMAIISISSLKEEIAYNMSKKILLRIPRSENIDVFGPSPSVSYKASKMFAFNIILKTSRNINIQKILMQTVLSEKHNSNLKIRIDIDG